MYLNIIIVLFHFKYYNNFIELIYLVQNLFIQAKLNSCNSYGC